uniref:Uncharacterized protein n=1 Tax=Megaselia scalaris TaxID=36166 RepID=T1H3C3_MEGSC
MDGQSELPSWGTPNLSKCHQEAVYTGVITNHHKQSCKHRQEDVRFTNISVAVQHIFVILYKEESDVILKNEV